MNPFKNIHKKKWTYPQFAETSDINIQKDPYVLLSQALEFMSQDISDAKKIDKWLRDVTTCLHIKELSDDQISKALDMLGEEIELPEDAIEIAICDLASVCDGATTQDKMGYAGMHTSRGRSLAAKIREGGKLSKNDLHWAQTALPYYFNTQLQWINKREFDILCGRKISEAEEKEKELEEQKEIEKNKKAEELEMLQDLDQSELKSDLKEVFKSGKIEQKDISFITNLVNWRGDWSDKQRYWAAKFVQKYT